MEEDIFLAHLVHSSHFYAILQQASHNERYHVAVLECGQNLWAFAVQASRTVEGDAQPDQAALQEQLAAAAQRAEALGADLTAERGAHAATRRQLLDLQRHSAKRPATPASAPRSPAAAGEPAAQTYTVRLNCCACHRPPQPRCCRECPCRLHEVHLNVCCIPSEAHAAIQT